MREERCYVGSVPPPNSKIPCVYMYRQIDTGKTYIGSTVNGYGRFIQHTSALSANRHGNKKFQKAFNESPFFEVHFVAVPPDKRHEPPLKVVREMEQTLLDSFPDKQKLLNIATDVYSCGGGVSPSQETRNKISAAMKGRFVSVETRQRRSATLMGHAVSDETKEKIRQAKLGKQQSPEHAAKSRKSASSRWKPVEVDGTLFIHTKAAALTHAVAQTTAVKRINSKNPAFQGWKYSNQVGNSPSL